MKEKEKEEKRKERERLLKDQEKKKLSRVKKQDKFCENVSDEDDVQSNDDVECPVCHLWGLSCQWICCDN